MSTVAEAIGYGVLAALSGLAVLLMAGAVVAIVGRVRYERRAALARLVDMGTGAVIEDPLAPREPALGRRVRRRAP